MFGERDYARGPLAIAPQFVDPDEVCFACEGAGHLKFHMPGDAAGAWEFHPCWACGGVATLGVYVVRLVGPRWSYELATRPTADFGLGAERCRRAAALVGGGSLGFAEARLVYLAVVDNPSRPGKAVLAVPVRRAAAGALAG